MLSQVPAAQGPPIPPPWATDLRQFANRPYANPHRPALARLVAWRFCMAYEVNVGILLGNDEVCLFDERAGFRVTNIAVSDVQRKLFCNGKHGLPMNEFKGSGQDDDIKVPGLGGGLLVHHVWKGAEVFYLQVEL